MALLGKIQGDLRNAIIAETDVFGREDLQLFTITPEDRILCLTSGGCNVLEYAIHGPERIYSIDINPCQGHIMELKLAALAALPYPDFYRLFGDGIHPSFSTLLDTHLSPYLSTPAYQFWKKNVEFSNLYETGGSGVAIRTFRYLVKVKRLGQSVHRLCACETIERQREVWNNELRPHFLSKTWIGLFNNHKFIWDYLGKMINFFIS